MFRRVLDQSVCWLAVALPVILLLPACAPPRVIVSSPPSRDIPSPSGQPAEEMTGAPSEPAPRVMASLRLAQQARILLEDGRTDDAISLLERAMTLNPTDGKNYYYLAEAWLRKGNRDQAEEFNRLAEIYLKENPEWRVKTMEQKQRIDHASR